MQGTDNHSTGSEGTKIVLRKKSQIYFLQWKLRGKNRMVLFSPLLPYLGRKKSHAFFRDPDGAHKEWFSHNTFVFSTVSRRNNPTLTCLLRVSTSFPLLITDVWDWNTGKIMVVWGGRRQGKQGTFHTQPALQEQTAIWDLYPHTPSANVGADFSNTYILLIFLFREECKRLISPADLLTCIRQRSVPLSLLYLLPTLTFSSSHHGHLTHLLKNKGQKIAWRESRHILPIWKRRWCINSFKFRAIRISCSEVCQGSPTRKGSF